MIRLFLLLAVLAPAGAQQVYDLLLKNGNVIDPANRRTGRLDVAVIGNRIARVAADLPAAHARVAIDASDYYVTPGLIDIHAHFYAGAEPILQPDHNSLPNGVTTAVDAGGADSKTFDDFKRKVIDPAKTRVLAFLNVANDLADPGPAARMIQKYRDTIVGIKTTADAADLAVKAAQLSGTVVMVDLQPESTVRPGDIQTQIYSRLVPLLYAGQNVPPWMEEARKRGVLFDVGHGSSGFWFRIAAPAIRQGFLPDTISTGIDRESALLPRATMMDVLSKFLNIGLTLEQVVERSTAKPARAIRRPDLGTLSEGAIADIALLQLQKGSFGYLDSGHAKLMGDRKLRCVLTIRNGAIVWDSEGLSAPDWVKAGPYSNFK